MPDNSTKILMIIDQFYPVIGGAEQQALRISRRLIKRGNTVSVLTRQSRPELKEYEEYEGIHIYRLPVGGFTGASKLKGTIPAVRWLINNRDKYDLIHCHGVNPVEWGALLASFVTRKPYVIKIPLPNYNYYANSTKGFYLQASNSTGFSRRFIRPFFLPALRLIRRMLIRRAGRVFAISPEIKNNLAGRGFNNISNIPNGVDTNEFRPVDFEEKLALRLKLRLPPGKTIFIYSGRLAAEKNIITLLRAWENASTESGFAASQLILLGGGENQPYSVETELREFIRSQGLTGVVFQGTTTNVIEFLQAADCFVLPSYWEGMSNALLEAMACGIPAIASDIAGNRSLIVQDQSGFLFPTTDHKKLAFYLLKVALDTNLRENMGRRARQIAIERFSLKKITDDIIGEYQKVLA
jgi:glycosyltransferase involved in cell wall biosynthesis